MKCYISLVHKARHGVFPDMAFMKSLGHDLDGLLSVFLTKYYGGLSRPAVKAAHDYVSTDTTLRECVRILSLFGKFGRYYNLDIVAGSNKGPINPKEEWEKLEESIEDPGPYRVEPERMHTDYYPKVNSVLIGSMERFARAIAWQFTIGDHADPSGDLLRMSTVVSEFLYLDDRSIGENDYRRSARIIQQQQRRRARWVKRGREEILGDQYPSMIVTKDSFQGDWPFRSDETLLQRRGDLFYIAYIGGYEFALNGAASSRFDIPSPHDAGVAILGKSIGPFIDLCRGL